MKIFPKAYIKTEIIKYLNKIENEEGELTVQDIFELLPEIYEHLQNDPEKPIDGMTYEVFYNGAVTGYQMAEMNAHMGFRF